MADWFVDTQAAGTGSGSNPTDAWTNICSGMLAQSANINYGDKIWIRRTLPLQVLSGATSLGKQGWGANSHSMSWVIGWPSSGQPFYKDRPAAGTSAGWDSDVNSPYLINLATFVWSSAPALTWNSGWGLANLLLVSTGPSGVGGGGWSGHDGRKSNLHYLNNYATSNNHTQFDDITITASYTTPSFALTTIVLDIGRLTLTSSCMIGVLFQGSSQKTERVNEVVINTSSLTWLAIGDSSGQGVSVGPKCTIGRISGTQPINGERTFNGMDNLHIDDWYGLGPRVVGGKWMNQIRRAAAGTASYSGTLASYMEVLSTSGLNNCEGRLVFGGPFEAKALVGINSGTPLVLRWPFLTCGSLFSREMAQNPWSIHLLGPGGFQYYIGSSDIQAGSASMWSGGSTGVSSAWNLKASFTPTDTGSAWVLLRLANARCDPGIAFMSLFPDVNSA